MTFRPHKRPKYSPRPRLDAFKCCNDPIDAIIIVNLIAFRVSYKYIHYSYIRLNIKTNIGNLTDY